MQRAAMQDRSSRTTQYMAFDLGKQSWELAMAQLSGV